MKRLENKTVFITGGLSGIGKACATIAAKEGANIVIADIKSDTMDRAYGLMPFVPVLLTHLC